MKGSPRTIALTDKGERYVDMMRAGLTSASPNLFGLCPVYDRYRQVTATGIVTVHALAGVVCRGTGRKAVAS